MFAACFPLAVFATAMLDSDRNPTGLDAPYPHYWINHGMWPIPGFFEVVGIIGLFVVYSWLSSWKYWVLLAYASIITYALTVIFLDGFFITHYNSFNGVDAFKLLGPPYLIVQWLLTSTKIEDRFGKLRAQLFQ